jgi:hypothetical protein
MEYMGMQYSKLRLIVPGVAAAAVLSMAALAYTGLVGSPRPAAIETGTILQATGAPAERVAQAKDGVKVEAPATRVETGRDVRVEAPGTSVKVDRDRGRVRVQAPHTDVKVDPDKGTVRVRAPYVNLDIRW